MQAGIYNDAKIVEHGFTKSSRKGTPGLWVKFHVPNVGDITQTFWITEGTAAAFMGKLKTMGFTGEDLKLLGDGECLAGNVVQIDVQETEFEGRKRFEVAWVNENNYAPGPRSDNSVASSVSAFNALWQKMAAGSTEEPPF